LVYKSNTTTEIGKISEPFIMGITSAAEYLAVTKIVSFREVRIQ
jgi:hypothetical protein